MSITIRRATVEDAADIARIHVQSWQETYAGLMPQSFLDGLSIPQRAANWTTHLQNPEGFPMFVALVDGIVCGIAGAGARRAARDDDDGADAKGRALAAYDAEVYLIYVLSEAKGKGIGRQLMRVLAGSLAGSGLRRPMLWVAAGNPAAAFYRHLGGREFGRKTEVVAGEDLEEIGYGWDDMSSI